ncbi:MAG: iron ABC transporter permease [Steroidobacteraceae bacterium]
MKRRLSTALLILLPLALLYVSLFVGRFAVSPRDVLHILASRVVPLPHDWSDAADTIVIQIRLPRAVLAMVVGAGLALSGAAFQGMFRNPLVSTDILGVTAAAGFGAALALLWSASALSLQLLSFAFGLAGVGLAYALARVYGSAPMLMLVLSGIVVAAFFSALLSGIKYLADPESRLPAITYWLLGSLNGTSVRTLLVAVPCIGVGCAGLLSLSWPLNVLTMGEEEARSLGVRTEWLKGSVIVFATLVTSAAVSVCGIVGWVGLVIPHLARLLVGPDHRALFPWTLSIGAGYLLLMDDLARTLTAGEIPLGILTALVGAPVFAFLLRRARQTWQ